MKLVNSTRLYSVFVLIFIDVSNGIISSTFTTVIVLLYSFFYSLSSIRIKTISITTARYCCTIIADPIILKTQLPSKQTHLIAVKVLFNIRLVNKYKSGLIKTILSYQKLVVLFRLYLR